MEKKKVQYNMGRILKKGQTGEDVIFAVIIIFVLAFFALVVTYSFNKFLDIARDVPQFNQSVDAIGVMEKIQDVNQKWDYVITAFFIGLMLVMIVSGYFVEPNTVFMVIYIIVLLVGGVISAIISYVWGNIEAFAEFTPFIATDFPILNHILTNILIYYSIAAGIALIANYAKTKREEGY